LHTSLDRLTAAIADRYTIERRLGEGGMATVYLAEDVKHHRKVALKVLRPELAAVLGADRFVQEITTTANLQHPHILPLFDSGEADGFLYYVMPFIDGETLRDRLNREKQLPVDEALRITGEIAAALESAHGQGVIHRDMKPENVLLDDGRAVVADFGIAKAVESAGGEKLTETGMALGTPAYMSPEQASAELVIDGRSDTYSLGCVLYEMLSGEPPYTGPTAQSLIAKKMVDPVPSVRRVRETISPSVDSAIMTALAKVPADRFATPAAFAEALSQPGEVTTARHSPKKGLVPAIVGAAIAALAAGAVWWATTNRGAATAPDLAAYRVAVFPARVLAADSTYLVDGIAELLHAALDGAGELRGVDPNALYAALRQRTNTPDLSPDSARAIAEQLGAGLFVLSRAVDVGGRLRITGQLYDVSRGTDAYATSVAESDGTQLPQKIEEVAWGLVSKHPVGSGVHLTDIASMRAENYTALKAYLEGEAATRRADYASAVASFTRAIEADSAFSLAWFRRAIIGSWFSGPDGVRSLGSKAFQAPHLAREAMRHRSGLSPSDSLLLLGWHAHLTGDPERAEQFTNALLATYPNHVEGLYLRAGLRGWYGWQSGRSTTAARGAFERVLEVDPGHPLATRWLTGLYMFEERYIELQELLANNPPGIAARPSDRALFAFMMGDESAQDAVIEELRHEPDAQIEFTAFVLGASGHLRAAARVSGVLLDSASRSGSESLAFGLLLGSRLDAARGRWNAASQHLTRLAAFAPGLALVHRSLLAMTPLLDVPDAELRVLLDSLDGWNGEFNTSPSVVVGGPLYGSAIPPEFAPHVRTYLLGLLHATLGERDDALGYATQLQQSAKVSDTLGLIDDAARDIQAVVALSSDDAEAAINLLEGAALTASPTDHFRSFLYGRSLHRMLRADALARLGRHQEALGWYSTVPGPLLPDANHLAISHHQRAQILAQLGDSIQAIEHYAKFIDMWSEADSTQQPLVTAARERISQLLGDPSRN
jgi:tetratricopeptide (TPR) repeat protein/tRNA A-37 threonylcarbamoyl transferase component Bud32